MTSPDPHARRLGVGRADVARFLTNPKAGLAAALALVLVVVAGVALSRVDAGAEPTGRTTHVTLSMNGMRYSQPTIEVPAGNRLVITLRNTDKNLVHDLALETGESSGRLAPGESTKMDVGVVAEDVAGWCTVAGHREMGMTLDIRVTGAATPSDDGSPEASNEGAGHHDGAVAAATGEGDAAEDMDLMAAPGPGFTPYDAELPPLEELGRGEVREMTLTISENEVEVAPGVRQKVWTFGDTAPGPVLHGEVGDTFEITLVNDGTEAHGIDFHAGALAPDEVMRPIPPGESLTYRFTATRAGIWMYHCSAMPMSVHIANGMFGAVVIEPPDLPSVDRSYVLVQSEQYLGPQGGSADPEKVSLERPDTVVFNGYPNQYDHSPLQAKVGERVRTWVLAAGPNRGTAFHVVGSFFDTVFFEGDYLLDEGSEGTGGSQALGLAPAQGGFVEMTFPEPGHYPFVSHAMVDAERGAHGHFEVTD
ncbi:MAG TPA: multicopper oxidase domain-containing protein [Nocardioidaceae bacterium]|nr:multicopper oxidase domain-containing protein [Nocardioidaceae bacterium]